MKRLLRAHVIFEVSFSDAEFRAGVLGAAITGAQTSFEEAGVKAKLVSIGGLPRDVVEDDAAKVDR